MYPVLSVQSALYSCIGVLDLEVVLRRKNRIEKKKEREMNQASKINPAPEQNFTGGLAGDQHAEQSRGEEAEKCLGVTVIIYGEYPSACPIPYLIGVRSRVIIIIRARLRTPYI